MVKVGIDGDGVVLEVREGVVGLERSSYLFRILGSSFDRGGRGVGYV